MSRLGIVELVENFEGVIQDFVFVDDTSIRMLAMNEPVSFFNVNIGRG